MLFETNMSQKNIKSFLYDDDVDGEMLKEWHGHAIIHSFICHT